ncbi:AAA family ATPase, partial [Actinotignum timonense]|uniref:AAA family ATPase n=1 Tax=Actinotignum timonense TaxID=1870995 RepID=UPI002550EA88
MVFVGDKNQLPPIEYGRPFELLQQSVTVSELKENRRSEAADIIALGKEVIGIPQNANMNTPNIVFAPTIQSAFEDE